MMQFLFPNEILEDILTNLSTYDLFFLKHVNRQFRHVIGRIEARQLLKVQLSFPGDNIQQFHHVCKSANYLLFDHYLNIFKGNKKRDFWFQFLNVSCLSGDYIIADYLIGRHQINQKLKRRDVTIWNEPFVNACVGGNIKLIMKLIELCREHNNNAIDWRMGLLRACSGGHIKIIDFMLEKMDDSKLLYSQKRQNLNDGLYGACYGGYVEIIDFMVEKMEQSKIEPNWNLGLSGACGGGHIKIVNYMIEKMEQSKINPKSQVDWNEGLLSACWYGQLEIVKFIIEKLEQLPDSANVVKWNRALDEACYGGNKEIVKIVVRYCDRDNAVSCHCCGKAASEH